LRQILRQGLGPFGGGLDLRFLGLLRLIKSRCGPLAPTLR
jgi:hypothetical protein